MSADSQQSRPSGAMPARLPETELQRLAALHESCVLDTPAEPAFDDLTALASMICGAPMALVSLVDRDRQWFKSRVGVEVQETPRDLSFCAHALLEPEHVFEISDTGKDARFVGREIRRRIAGGPRSVAVTANAMGGDDQRCFEAGMDDYSRKPIDLRERVDALTRTEPNRAQTQPGARPLLPSHPFAPSRR